MDALPEYDETTPSRTVVALNLPIERPTIEAVAELFKVCGEIVLVRILRPGNPIPADVKPFSNKHPEMTDKVCALVEFEKTEFAHKAVKDLCKEGEEGMKVKYFLTFGMNFGFSVIFDIYSQILTFLAFSLTRVAAAYQPWSK